MRRFPPVVYKRRFSLTAPFPVPPRAFSKSCDLHRYPRSPRPLAQNVPRGPDVVRVGRPKMCLDPTNYPLIFGGPTLCHCVTHIPPMVIGRAHPTSVSGRSKSSVAGDRHIFASGWAGCHARASSQSRNERIPHHVCVHGGQRARTAK